jgi:hypothetical protein
MPRTTSLTPELQAKFVATLVAGKSPGFAMAACGISARTYFNWVHRGRGGEAPFVQFVHSVSEARARGAAALFDTVKSAAQTNPRLAAWVLESGGLVSRKRPDPRYLRGQIRGPTIKSGAWEALRSALANHDRDEVVWSELRQALAEHDHRRTLTGNILGENDGNKGKHVGG